MRTLRLEVRFLSGALKILARIFSVNTERCKSGLIGWSRKPSGSQDPQRFESSPLRMKFQFSAGGIVYKNQGKQTLILVSKHSGHKGWVFPKGLIGDKISGEKKEDTAVREVEEETGIKAEIEKELPPVTYWFKFEGDPSTGFHSDDKSSERAGQELIKKTVYYFIMKAVGGSIEKHDMEMEEVEWLPMSEVENRLTYPSDKSVWKVAQDLIK